MKKRKRPQYKKDSVLRMLIVKQLVILLKKKTQMVLCIFANEKNANGPLYTFVNEKNANSTSYVLLMQKI